MHPAGIAGDLFLWRAKCRRRSKSFRRDDGADAKASSGPAAVQAVPDKPKHPLAARTGPYRVIAGLVLSFSVVTLAEQLCYRCCTYVRTRFAGWRWWRSSRSASG